MINKSHRIWIWIQNNRLYKAVYNPREETLTIYNENDIILVRRKGFTEEQLKKLEIIFSSMGARKIDSNKEPFTYL